MAAPVDASRSGTGTSIAGTNHTFGLGAAPSSGDLLIFYFRAAAAPGTITFTGYSSLANDTSDATDDTTAVYYKVSDGTEGEFPALTTANSVKSALMAWRVTGAQAEAPTISTAVIGTTTANTANSGSVAPNSAPQDTLYISMCGGGGELADYTAAPTNYGNLVIGNSGSAGAAATNCFCGGASRQITNSSSDDAGVFTHGAHTGGWTGFAVALRAAAAATPTSLDLGLLARRTPRRRVLNRM